MATLVKLKGRELAEFNRVMQEVGKEMCIAKIESLAMAKRARIATANAYFNR